MKLRNKKTGEIVDVESLGHAESLKEKYGYQVTLSWKTKYENLSQCKSYESLAELNEDWEDYKPKEPLIKDEDAQKAVRAWAQHWEINRVKVKLYRDVSVGLIGRDQSSTKGREIYIDGAYVSDDLKDGEEYAIDELCGEEGLMGIYEDFKYKVGDKVLFKDFLGRVKRGMIIGRRRDALCRYYAIKTLFTKDDIFEFDIYDFINHKGE